MKKILLLLVFGLTSLFPDFSFAQQKEKEAKVVLHTQLGYLLRKTHRNDLAFENVKKGLEIAKAEKDMYWEGVAYEYIGLIYKERGDSESASNYFYKALEKYQTQNYDLAAAAVSDLIDGETPTADLYKSLKINAPATAKESFVQIRTAFTLIEAGQFEMAEKVLKQNLEYVKGKNYYWEATANEGLGLLYRQTDKIVDASQYFTKSQQGFDYLKLALSSYAIQNLLRSVQGQEEVYGGIEIGAKGIITSVVGITIDKNGFYKYNVKYSETDNSKNLINPNGILSAETVAWAAGVVEKSYNFLGTSFELPSEKIFIVGSSGLRLLKAPEVIAKKIQSSLGNVKVEILTPEKEAEMLLKGIMPDKMRYTACLADIGSGNVKGGYWVVEKDQLVPFTADFGTESFHEMIDKERKAGKGDYGTLAKNMAQGKIKPIFQNEFNTKPILRTRKEMCLTGGIVWAMATYLKPETINDPVVSIKVDDIAKFKNMANISYDKLTKPDLSKLSGDSRAKAEKDLASLQSIFNKENIVAGSQIMDVLTAEFNQPEPNKNFYFLRYGYVGWVTGYIVQYLDGKYRSYKDE